MVVINKVRLLLFVSLYTKLGLKVLQRVFLFLVKLHVHIHICTFKNVLHKCKFYEIAF